MSDRSAMTVGSTLLLYSRIAFFPTWLCIVADSVATFLNVPTSVLNPTSVPVHTPWKDSDL